MAKPVGDPIDIISILLWSKEGCLTISIHRHKFNFLKSVICFIRRRDAAKAESVWGPFQFFHFIVF